jgi:hypothetical protein
LATRCGYEHIYQSARLLQDRVIDGHSRRDMNFLCRHIHGGHVGCIKDSRGTDQHQLKSHPDINDCLVVGLADERFGQKVAAVVEMLQPDADPLATIRAYSEPLLAAYKLPRSVLVVDAIQRGPNGKPDYKWAKALAEKSLA